MLVLAPILAPVLARVLPSAVQVLDIADARLDLDCGRGWPIPLGSAAHELVLVPPLVLALVRLARTGTSTSATSASADASAGASGYLVRQHT